MAAKIRQNDEVIVLAGKDKGKRGKVTNQTVKCLLKVSTSSLNMKNQFLL